MTNNQIKVRRKETVKPRRNRIYLFAALAVIFGAGLVALVGANFLSGHSTRSFAPLEITAQGKGRLIRVPAGGDLQAAVNKAAGGDVIELQAGATYEGEITLPKKAIDDFITIQSSRAKELPEDQRVSPQQADLMAKIVTKGGGRPTLITENGAHHYRLIGIEFAPSNSDYIYNLIFFGEPDTIADTAHHLEIDRCYVHSLKSGVTRRGLALNSAETVVKNSYFSGFGYQGEETQGICGWTGTKNVQILNNYIEGGAENIMFGGQEPATADLVPENIEVRGNHLRKPPEWRAEKASMKNLFELKDAKNVRLVGNYLENSWMGSALTITVRNETGKAPFSTIEDVLIKDNIIDGAGDGINVLGSDNNYPSQTLTGLKIQNNLFLNIGGDDFPISSGYFLQITDGKDFLIANNTAFNIGNIAKMYGTMPKDFLFRDNIINHGNYGIHGHPDIYSTDGQKLYQNNVFVNNKNVPPSDYSFPKNNFLVENSAAVGFLDPARKDFRLAAASRFRGKGAEGSNIGMNLIIADYQKIKSKF